MMACLPCHGCYDPFAALRLSRYHLKFILIMFNFLHSSLGFVIVLASNGKYDLGHYDFNL